MYKGTTQLYVLLIPSFTNKHLLSLYLNESHECTFQFCRCPLDPEHKGNWRLENLSWSCCFLMRKVRGSVGEVRELTSVLQT